MIEGRPAGLEAGRAHVFSKLPGDGLMSVRKFGPKASGSPVVLLLLVLAGALLFGSAGEAPAADSPDSTDPQELILSTRESYSLIDDYTATFIKQERVNGRLKPVETVFMKFQKPFKVYMKWVEGAKEGQEILYVEGKNGGKVLAHPGFGGFLGGMLTMILPTFAISPDGPTAMKDNLHPVTDAGIGNMIENIISNNAKARTNDDLHLYYRGESSVDGRMAFLVERILPQEEGYPAHRAQLFIDKEYRLPIMMVLHDWSDELIGSYEFRDLVLNPGLAPEEFEHRNKDYRFGVTPPIIKD